MICVFQICKAEMVLSAFSRKYQCWETLKPDSTGLNAHTHTHEHVETQSSSGLHAAAGALMQAAVRRNKRVLLHPGLVWVHVCIRARAVIVLLIPSADSDCERRSEVVSAD